MVIQPAEECFRKGLQALTERRGREAMAMFESALELERRTHGGRPQARYLSYYGLSLGLETNHMHEALRFCREAVTLESYNPDIRCNLARVLLRVGRRKEAHKSLKLGLALQGNHPGIIEVLKELGLRRRPVLPFLSRRHPVNVMLGRMRYRLAS
jgi:predicted Zn-dependent protease